MGKDRHGRTPSTIPLSHLILSVCLLSSSRCFFPPDSIDRHTAHLDLRRTISCTQHLFFFAADTSDVFGDRNKTFAYLQVVELFDLSRCFQLGT